LFSLKETKSTTIRQIGTHGLPVASILSDTKFFDIRIKHELFTGDQRNVQETPVTFNSLSRNALNKGMSFE
jgi:hypothetical protein